MGYYVRFELNNRRRSVTFPQTVGGPEDLQVSTSFVGEYAGFPTVYIIQMYSDWAELTYLLN